MQEKIKLLSPKRLQSCCRIKGLENPSFLEIKRKNRFFLPYERNKRSNWYIFEKIMKQLQQNAWTK